MMNEINNQVIELSAGELEIISGGGIFDGNRNPEEEAQELLILNSLESSKKSSVFGTLDGLKSQAEGYMKN